MLECCSNAFRLHSLMSSNALQWTQLVDTHKNSSFQSQLQFEMNARRLMLLLIMASCMRGLGVDLSELDADEIHKLGATFYLAHQSSSTPRRQPKEVRDFFNLDAKIDEDNLWISGIAVDLISVRKSTPGYQNKLKNRLAKHGVVAIPKLVDSEICKNAASRAIEEIRNPKADAKFGRIMRSEFRKDLPLDWGVEPYSSVMQQVLKSVGATLVSILGEKAQLVEYGTLTSFPGAQRQPGKKKDV